MSDKEKAGGSTSVKVGSVNSVRFILYSVDEPCQVAVRQGSSGNYGLGGGKKEDADDPRVRCASECGEEFEIELPAAAFRPEGVLLMPKREIEYTVGKYRGLGFELPGEHDDDEVIRLANPVAFIYSAAFNGELSKEKPEGRKLRWIDVRKKKELELVKSRHRLILDHWRIQQRFGTNFPSFLFWPSPVSVIENDL